MTELASTSILREPRLRVAVLVPSSLDPITCAFLERLARDPLVELCGIVVSRLRPLASLRRNLRGLGEGGLRGLWFVTNAWLGRAARTIAVRLFDVAHPRMDETESHDAFGQRTGVRVGRVPDVNDGQTAILLGSLHPDLVISLGMRVYSQGVLAIPTNGTIVLQLCSQWEDPGPGVVGYHEILAGEPGVRVTVRYGTDDSGPGPLLASALIPIEAYDTLESLNIKAHLRGVQLCYDAIARIATGTAPMVLPEPRGPVPSGPGPRGLDVERLRRELRRRAEAGLPYLRNRPSVAAIARVTIQYVILMPLLLWIRWRLLRSHRAPVGIICYHVVANRPLNHLCVPLDEFVDQVLFLRRYCRLLPLDEAVHLLKTGRNDTVGAVVTFDDGYRDNEWAIEYLRYLEIPAAFFVSIGHVFDGIPFEHDTDGGFDDAPPMTTDQVRRLADQGFLVGSHSMYHEDYARLDPSASEEALARSQELIARLCGRLPEHFAFPIGQRENITGDSVELAHRRYRYVYSAFGGYNFPGEGGGHLRRFVHPSRVVELAMIMDGYTGLRQCLRGYAWEAGDLLALPKAALSRAATGRRGSY